MRMRQSRAEMPDVGRGGRVLPYPHVGAVGEPPAVRDEQIGQMFRNMRSAMKVSRETIARRLATSPSTIDNFEAGAIAALPHWKETARVVRGYCELVRMDPEPTLWRLRNQLQALAGQARPAGPPSPRVLLRQAAGAPGAASRTGEAGPARTHPARRRRRARALFALSAPLALLVAVAILLQAMPGPVYRLVGLLPGVVEAPARAGLDYVALLTAPRRDGLRWIEVSDPRLRKADKLQTSRR